MGNARFLSSVQVGWGQKSVERPGSGVTSQYEPLIKAVGSCQFALSAALWIGKKNNTIGHRAAFVL